MFRILIAEDDKNLNRLLQRNLESTGYQVIGYLDGKEALQNFEPEKFDLIVTDIMMPHMDGDAFVTEIKKIKPDFPIIMLTALDSIENKKNSFTRGADDYLTKPIDFEELTLRIEALLRRYKLVNLKNISHKEIKMDYNSKSLYREGQPIDLTKKEFYLLYMLISSPGKIYSRTQILDEVWGYDADSLERTVDVHVNKLRDKLAGGSIEILTVRGLGYKAVLK